jgi:predicted RNase H-like HicB family nuclease
MATLQEIQLNASIWKEGTVYVAHNPQLDISSCGDTAEEAKKNLREAVTAFIAETRSMGTLQQILEEAGFLGGTEWSAPVIAATETMRFAL